MTAAGIHGGRWSARPWAARGLRLAVFGLPILASVAVVQAVTSFTGVPTSSLWVFLGWWLGVSILASVVVSALYALTRRLLPLSGLLGLSLVFPDEAPSRFRLALATGTVESLQERLRRGDAARRAGSSRDPPSARRCARRPRPHHTRSCGARARVRREPRAPDRPLRATTSTGSTGRRCCTTSGSSKVDAEILNKPGRPTDDEWAQLRRHPLDGELLVAAAARLARRVGRRDRLPPRELGRHRLSARHRRRGDSARRPNRRDRGRLRRDHVGALL